MTRRRVVFIELRSGSVYITPEFNGDKREFEQFIGKNGDSCTATWEEIAEIFRPVKRLEEFRAASETAQKCYISSFGTEIQPIEQVPDIAGINADEFLLLPVLDHHFTNQEFKYRMFGASGALIADFIGRGFLNYDADGMVTGIVDLDAEIDAVLAQMPMEEIEKYWRLMLDERGKRDGN